MAVFADQTRPAAAATGPPATGTGSLGNPNCPSAAGLATRTTPAADTPDAETTTFSSPAAGSVTTGAFQCEAASVSSVPSGAGLGVCRAPASAADSSDRTLGGCSFDSDSSPGATETTAVLSDASVTHTADGLPIGATISCTIQVNGVDAPGASADFPGYGSKQVLRRCPLRPPRSIRRALP